MNLHDCLQRAMDFGEIDRARGVALQGQYDQLRTRYETMMGPAAAAARAAADLKEAFRKAKTSRFHKVVNQLQAMRRLRAQIEQAPDPAVALRNLLEHSDGSGYTGESVRSISEAYEASINAGLRDALEAVGLNVIGSSRNPVLLRDLIRELHAEASGNAQAKAMADAVRTVQQRMRRAFNSYGGDIGEIADYGVPHSHDAGAMRQAGFERWAAEIEQRLAWDRIVDFNTDQPFAAPGQIPPRAVSGRFLKDVYEGIVTRGWDDRDPSLAVGGKALANQRAERRLLHFRSGSDWIEYNKAFGASDPFSAMMNGLHGLARDVALMRVLGPSPKAGLEYAAQVAKKRAATIGNQKLEARVDTQSKVAKAMLMHLDGSANVPERAGWASFFGGTRAVLTSIQLGSAVLSSVSDVATMTAAAHSVGLSATSVLGRSVQLMASQATRETAARMGYVAGALADAGGGASRYFGQLFGTGIPARMAGFTLRATGLSFVTDMRKLAWQMEFSGYMAENAGRTFADIDAPLRQLFERRGITAADWDLLRDPAFRFREPGGADFVSPIYWLHAQNRIPHVEAEGLAMRLQAAILEELEFAIPTASIEGRALLQGTAAPGSVAGELMRSSMSYKSFSLSLMLNQYRRFASLPTPWDKAKYAAKVSTLLLVTGAVAIQLKELAKGNDPRPMDENKFWLAALFQGGGLGIFGDFFSAETSRVGGGLAETIAGPVVGAAGDLLKPVASNITRAVQGEDTLVGRDVAGLVRRNTPFLSSAWYARTAYSRLVADELQAFLDPEAEVLFRRRMKKMAKDYGTQPWVPQRGTSGSWRLPDFGNALGGGP
ncbi:hypothetical protein [Cereibacter azotoformans]|uniref:hypothetical protein n=1 Tax=Cereibacter azotoformans TaxID=43057 RepID=UPI000C6EBE01|nr:hypothetical protein [Cereibacter azotoformans]